MLPNTGRLAGRTLFITGASRGIGKSIALKAARDGANIVIAAKTATTHPKLPGTIYTAAEEIEKAGGKALPCIVDVRSEVDVMSALENVEKTFGGIDILINNASAISLTGTSDTDMKKYDLMNQVNARATFMVSKLCLPFLQKSSNPHILNISPPLNMNPIWFKNHVAYTMAKYGMSMCVLGMAEEFKSMGIAVNAIWPRTAISTAAMKVLGGSSVDSSCRKPEIMADAAYAILSKDAKSYTGNFAIDDDVLSEAGIKDLTSYAVDPKCDLIPDFFLDECDVESIKKQFNAERIATDEGGRSGVSAVFDKLSSLLSAELVNNIGAVYSFELSGGETGKWYLSLREGTGSCGIGDPPCKIDTTMKMNSDDFVKMFQGQLKPTAAFMSGQLKISGDMSKALKLDKLMNQVKSKL